ncbi:MAG TPA: DUF4148 domain-containing protein [Burkholderiaceae bacterium]
MNFHRFAAVPLMALALTTQSHAQGETRAEVEAEGRAAMKAGQIPVGETGKSAADLKASRAASAASSGVTRDQVKAELKAAERSGDMQVGELGKTQAEEDPARYAGAPEKAPKLKVKKVDLTRYHKRRAASAVAASASQ